jgi:hypothetical protein
MKLEPKLKLAKQHDEYVNNKPKIPEPEPEPEPEQIVCIPKQTKQNQRESFIKKLRRKKRKKKLFI